jgi:hypothetical protein
MAWSKKKDRRLNYEIRRLLNQCVQCGRRARKRPGRSQKYLATCEVCGERDARRQRELYASRKMYTGPEGI